MVIMSIERNKYILHRLSEGVEERAHIDSPEYSTQLMFDLLTLDFSNELLYVQLPADVEDLEDFDSLNAKDSTRMKIMRDGEHYFYIICIIS